MTLSIVTTLYKSSLSIDEFYTRISKEAQQLTQNYEIIFVNDGSPDDSLKKAVKWYEKDSRVIVIELSRNFGHHKAIMTGLAHARGKFVFLIDSDLEEEPELLGKFWQELHKEENVDVVYGVQESRKGSWFERWSGEVFYNLFNKISSIDLPKNLITCRLTTQAYNQALLLHQEREIFLAGLWSISGFNQKPIIVKKYSYSETSYGFRQKISILFNSITSFSTFPLRLVFYVGISISLISFIYILWIIFKKLFFNLGLDGWSSLIVSVWFLGGIILASLGILGIYISKIFIETKQRPYTIIKKQYKRGVDE